MGITVKSGIVLGVLVGVWTFVMGFTGWYKDPVLLNMFWIVIVIQIVLLLWTLRQTANAGARYGAQVWNGTLMSLVGGAIIFASSMLFTTVFFPQYFDELRQIQGQMLKQAGQSDAEIKAALDAGAATATPFYQALFGFIGTVVTGVVVSAVAGAFLRKK
jgi:hypothetical protein